jgi:hypothetical protein
MIESSPEIRYLDRSEIDIEKWDRCILNAPNGLIYARSFYLDAMSKNWSALILNDYECVMPLTWNRKFGISYLYQPAFASQLGIFFENHADTAIFEKFVRQAKFYFRFCEIHLNFANSVEDSIPRANYILNLARPYPEIRNGYKKRLIENLNEAEFHHLIYTSSNDCRSAIKLFKNQYGKRFPKVQETDFQRFEKLCDELINKNMLFLREIKDESDELLNISIFIKDDRRIYNIMSVSLPLGREKRAHFYLLDHLIMEFASQDLILDFEGSEVPGIAEFYRKFGSINQPYSFLKFNHLPLPIRLLK